MNCHFTYVDNYKRDDLRQGDLLRITDDLSSVLKKYHPHYLKSDYIYFLVLSQSCDLVRREGRPCNANYISLAAVRPFDVVIQRKVQSIQKEEFEKKAGICRLNRKSKIEDFTRKVLNNNHNEFFYLHEDNELGLPEPCCAFLRLSIALRSSEHYEKCIDAKFLELTDEFRAKLGWLVGNLYSRVGTMDWTPDYKTNEEFKKIVNDILERQFVWFPIEVVTSLKKKIEREHIDISSLEPDKIQELALDIQIPTKEEKKKTVLKSIKRILAKSEVLAEGVDVDNLLFKIENDPVFKSNIKY